MRVLDLFSGAGGSSYGAIRAGAEIVAGLDLWEVATKTYKANFPHARVITRDIRKISPKQLHSQVGKVDLIVASPECTNHSCARGDRARCDDSRETAFQVTRFAKEFMPKWIIIENVVQMQSWSRHSELLQKLWRLGYFVREEKFDAKDFGVPQSRRRLFLLCSLTGKADTPHLNSRQHKPASTIINTSDIYPFSPLVTRGRAKPTLERAERAISALGSREPFLIVYYGSDGGGGWQSLDKPLRTVTTLDRFAYVVSTRKGHMMRMLQPDELKLAMGFPKRYKLEASSRREKIKLLGNAVCPPVMERLVRSLIW